MEDQAPQLPQGPVRVPPEMILSFVAENLQDNIVILPMSGWEAIIQVIQEHDDKDLIAKLEALQVPVVPVMLEGLVTKKEESRIILPGDMPKGDGKIILL